MSSSEWPPEPRKLSTEEVQDAHIGLLEWELEERDNRHGIDTLTGVKKREKFEAELDQLLRSIRGEVPEHNRSGDEQIKEVSLIFIDLDGFKSVNDTLGHHAGDEVLKKVAGVLTSSVRDTDVVGRFGGDEFFIFLPRDTEAQAEIVANKIRANLENHPKLKELNVTGSIGVCSSDISTDLTELVHFADTAAKESKQGGKNRVTVYTPKSE